MFTSLAKYSLEAKQDTVERSLFKEKLAEYIRIAKESPAILEVWFWDEIEFILRVIRRKNWTKKGPRSKKRRERRKDRINVINPVRSSDNKRWVNFITSWNLANFYAELKKFYGDLRAEWILPGNLAKDFEDKGCKFAIILGDASFHKKAAVLQKIAAEMPNLIIEFLPKYSPDYKASLISIAFG